MDSATDRRESMFSFTAKCHWAESARCYKVGVINVVV